jgi:hypothetical protein
MEKNLFICLENNIVEILQNRKYMVNIYMKS